MKYGMGYNHLHKAIMYYDEVKRGKRGGNGSG
jgi:hypothetical protein